MAPTRARASLTVVLLLNVLAVAFAAAPAGRPRVRFLSPLEGGSYPKTFEARILVQNFNRPADGHVALFVNNELHSTHTTGDVVSMTVPEVGFHTVSAVCKGRDGKNAGPMAVVNIEVNDQVSTDGTDGGDEYQNLLPPEASREEVAAATAPVADRPADAPTDPRLGPFSGPDVNGLWMRLRRPMIGDVFAKGDDVVLQFDVGGMALPGDGFVYVLVDGLEVARTEKPEEVIFGNFTLGRHNITIALSDKSRQFLKPHAITTQFEVVQPGTVPAVTLYAPQEGDYYQDGEVNVRFGLDGFTVPDEGRIFVWMDGGGVHFFEGDGDSITMSGLKPGVHEIQLMLAGVDQKRVGLASSIVKFIVEEYVRTSNEISSERLSADDFDVHKEWDNEIGPKLLLMRPAIPDAYHFIDSEVLTRFNVTNFVINKDGRVKLTIGGKFIGYLDDMNEDIVLGNFVAGDHVMSLKLVDMDDKRMVGPFTTVETLIHIGEVGAYPSVAIISPVEGEEFPVGTGVEVKFEVEDISIPDQGQLYVIVNAQGAHFWNKTTPFTMLNLSEGTYEVALALAGPDNRRLPAVQSEWVEFTVQAGAESLADGNAAPLGANDPHVVIYSPKDGTLLEDEYLDVEYSVRNFRIPADGKMAVIIDSTVTTYITEDGEDFSLANTPPGEHVLLLSLVDHDMKPIGKQTIPVKFTVPTPEVEEKKHQQHKKAKTPQIVMLSPVEGVTYADGDALVKYTISEGFQVPEDGFVRVFIDDEHLGNLDRTDSFRANGLEEGDHRIELELLALDEEPIQGSVAVVNFKIGESSEHSK